MNTLQKAARRWSLPCFWAACFLFLFVLNRATPFIADDFTYLYSFLTNERITSLTQIIPSMVVHASCMNGRLVSHGIMQISGMLPTWIFDLANAAVFCLVVYAVSRLAPRKSIALPPVIALALWVFTPDFGQAMLWQVGALNYLWGVGACLLLLTPFFAAFFGKETSTPLMILLTVLAFFIGAYTEVSSFVAIAMGGAMLLVDWVFYHRKPRLWLVLLLVLTCAGYAAMLAMPAELGNKQGGFDLGSMALRFIRITKIMLTRFSPLLLIWLVLFIRGIRKKAESKRLWLSVIFLLGAVGGGYMLIVGAYVPLRCFVSVPALLCGGCAVLLPEKPERREKQLQALAAGILVAVAIPLLVLGTADICRTGAAFAAREAQIETLKSQGETELRLPVIQAKTSYSAFWDLRDMSLEDSEDWPNFSMKKYYGVTSILGYQE